jgi:hypothetical protein
MAPDFGRLARMPLRALTRNFPSSVLHSWCNIGHGRTIRRRIDEG